MATILSETSAALIDGNNLIKGKLSISDSILLFTLPDGGVRESFQYDIVSSVIGKGQVKVRSFIFSKEICYARVVSENGKSSGMYSIEGINLDTLIGSFNAFKLEAEDKRKREEEAENRAQREQILKKIETDSKTAKKIETVAHYDSVVKAKNDFREGVISEQELVSVVDVAYDEEQERLKKIEEQEKARRAEEKRKRTEEFERQQAIARHEQEERLRIQHEIEEEAKRELEAREAEENRQREIEAKRKEEEERKRQEEAEEERKRKFKEEQRRKAEEEKKKREEEARRIEEECARIEAEAKAKEEEERRAEEEEKRREEEKRHYNSSAEAGSVMWERVNYYLREAGMEEIHFSTPEEARQAISKVPPVIMAKMANIQKVEEPQAVAESEVDFTKIDYPDEWKFEELLNDKKILDGKIVSFVVREVKPDSALGYNLYAANHLNFVSDLGKSAKKGDRCVVKIHHAEELTFIPGSWVITYSALKVLNIEEKNKKAEQIPENAIYVDGKPYANKAEIARAYGIAPATLYNKLKKGWTYEQAVGLEEYVPPKVQYKDKEYDSEQALAESFGVAYTTYKSRLSHGWTQDEALGVVARIPEDKSLSNLTFSLEDVCPAIKNIYETNPYCVLGISALSTRKEALTVSGKLEKYDKLKILNKYSTSYDLVAMQAPNRELGHVQTTMMNLEKMQYRWLWFKNESMPAVWNRKVFETYGKGNIVYDGFLACLFNCMISDAKYDDVDKWKALILLADKIVSKSDDDLFKVVKDHVNEDDGKKYNFHMVVKSFREAIIGTFIINVEQQSAELNSKFLSIIKGVTVSFKDEIIQKIANGSIAWIDYETGIIVDTAKHISDKKNGNYTLADAREVANVIEVFYDKKGFENVESIAQSFDGVGIYSEMIREKLRRAIWDSTDIINRGGDRKKAAKYDSMIYMYCDDKQKKQLKGIYNVEDMIGLPDSELTAQECDQAADRYKKADKPRKEFEWRLKAAEKGWASAMNEVGVAYATGKGVAKSERKAVEWYKKGADRGNACACSNLASRYANGSLPGGNSKAKEYYIKAFIHGSMDDSGKWLDAHYPGWKKDKISELDNLHLKLLIEPVANAGVVYAQFLMGKYLNEGGILWTIDKTKSKEWLTKAANNGSAEAKTYLKAKFGIDLNRREFQHIEDTQIYNGYSTQIEFCGIEHVGSKYGLKFWVFNESAFNRTVWLKSCTVNGNSYGQITKLGEYESSKGHYGTYFIDDINPSMNSCIKLEFELDNDTTEIATLCRLTVNLNGTTKDVTFSTEILNRFPTNAVDEDEDIEYELTEDEFTDETIFDDGKVHIEFCGVNLDYDEECELKFWVKNQYGSNISIWARNITVDGEQVKQFEKICDCNNGLTDFGGFVIPDIDPTESYDIELEIEVNDSNNQTLYDACSLSFSVGGDGDGDFYISYEDLGSYLDVNVDDFDPDEDDDDVIVDEDDSLFCPGSRYQRNYSVNGIEIYFASKPSEYVRDILKDEGWRWYQSKGCWYTYYSEDHLNTAKMITGSY